MKIASQICPEKKSWKQSISSIDLENLEPDLEHDCIPTYELNGVFE